MDKGRVPLVDLYYKQNKATQTDLLLSYPDIVNQLLQDLTQKLLVMSASDTLNSSTIDNILNDNIKTDDKIGTGDKNVIYSEIKRPKDKIKVARGKVKSLQNHFEQLSSSAINCDDSLTPCSRSRLPSAAGKKPFEHSDALLSPRIVSSLSKRFQTQANIDDSLISESTLVGDSTTSTPNIPTAGVYMTKQRNHKQQSNITLYEDVEDVFEYLDEKPSTIYASPVFANLPPSPPPRSRLFATTTTVSKRSAMLRKKRKNLASHLGLDSLSASTIDIANAQKIALENMQKNSSVINSKKKDLNKFLGLNESMNSSASIPVKLREKKQRRHSVSNTSSFIDNLKSNKIFKISSRKSENMLNSSHLKDKKLRRNLLEDLSLEDSGFEKSRTSSFSSVKSSTTTSSITETSEDEYLSGFSADNFRGFSTDLAGGFSNYNGSNYSSGSESLGLPLIPFTPPPSNISLQSPQRRKSGFEIFSDYCSMDVAASMLNTAAAQRRRSMSLSASCQYDQKELLESNGENNVYVEMRRQQFFTDQEYVTKSLVI